MRSIKHFLLTTLAVLCSTLTTWAAYSGTPATPSVISGGDFDGYYAIGTAEELYGFADLVNGGETGAKAVLTDDIVVNENVLNAEGKLNGDGSNFEQWTPIGTNESQYQGTFDGNGHTISGLYFNNTTNSNYPDGGKYVGLIGVADGAEIKNVGVIGSYIRGYTSFGGICGVASNSNITNCYNTGTVSGHNNTNAAGGICANGKTTTITNCYNTGKVTGGRHNIGGICGVVGTQINCYYLEGSCSAGGGGVSATAEDFANGKVTWLLNGSTSGNDNAWRQTFGVGGDAYPVLDNSHAVVYATQPCHTFSNDENETHKEHMSDAIGHCTDCGQYTVQATLVTESNYSGLNLTADFIDYYAISSAAQLYWFADLVNNSEPSANAVLTDNIEVNKNILNDDGTLNGTPTYSWTPIGTNSKKYTGTFDGNGHTISGLYFDNTTDDNYPAGGNYVGLIGRADGAAIKNVGVIGSYIRGYTWVGGICGYNYNGTQTNCHNTGTVTGSYYYVGGICGEYGTQTNCYNTGTVSGSSRYVGGICGSDGTQTNCYNMGTVSSSSYYVGGICGYAGTQTDCYNTGTVSGSSGVVGGICGYNGTQTNCYNTGTVSSSSNYVGGICGHEGSQTNCYYLAGCAKDGNNVVQYGVGNEIRGKTTADVADKTTAATAEEFASGKITYLLNGSTSEGDLAWYQTIDGTDALPTLDGSHGTVYAEAPCMTGVFSNTALEPKNHDWNSSGQCTVCGAYLSATLVTAENYSVLGLTADYVGYFAISTAEGLYSFAEFVNGGATSAKAVLTKDIVVNENVLNDDGTLNGTPTYSWTPIGTYSKNYKGIFDGNGHTIKGLYFDNTTNDNYPAGGNFVGLIGYAYGATIKNVGVIGSYIRGYTWVGGICGFNYNGTQTNCHNTGTVSGSDSYVGGICGHYGAQTNCYNTGTVSGSEYVGGICGSDGSQTNCYNTGTVSGTSSNSYYVGVISGYRGTQTNCYYLEGCGSKSTRGVSATAEEFASGKIAYLLNGNTSEGDLVWYQTIGDGNDAYPVLDNTHAVVYATQPCLSYSNDANNTHKEHPSTDNVTGRCTACDRFAVQATSVTASNYSDLNLTDDFVGYYAISNSAQLYWFADLVNNSEPSANAVLTADIFVNRNVLTADGTLNGTPTYSWTPIGTSSKAYTGTFDGNGHTISGLYFENTTNDNYPYGGKYVGLIGYADGAAIKNLGVIGSYIRGDSYVGGICGYKGSITNCYNAGTVSGSYDYVGGICGWDGTQTNCYNTGTVSGSYSYVGGICGGGGTQTNCYNLEGCCSAGGGGVSATAEEVASGKITYLLNGSASGVDNMWRQTLGSGGDATPVLDNTHAVVYATQPCLSYSNEASETHKGHPSMDAIGRCTACNQFIAHGTLVTESNYSGLNLSADFVDYYAISNSAELYWFADLVNNGTTDAKAVLTKDIVVNEKVLNDDGTLNGTPTYSWTPIGTERKKYKGTFDGNNHTIKGLYFNNTTNTNYPDGGNNVGLIGYADEATIKNVGVIGSYIRGYSCVGGICGYCNHSNTNTNIANCYNTGTVSGSSSYVGGICGYAGTQTNCHNTGTVSGFNYVGGICGSGNTQTNCYNTGTISGSQYVGGICGWDGTQTNCYNTGTVSGSYSYVGGICGSGNTQTNCYNTGTISGSQYVGGICGRRGTQTNCYNTGMVSGSGYVGGICGVQGIQTKCYYLEGCCSSSGGGISATATEFAGGKVAYLLNNSHFNNGTWRQTLFADASPVFNTEHNIVTGYVYYISKNENELIVSGNLVVATDYEIAEGKTLTIDEGTSLTTTGEAVITNNGTIICNGTIAGNNLAGEGNFYYTMLADADVALNIASYPYKGTAYEIGNGLDITYATHTILGKEFTFSPALTTIKYAANTNAGAVNAATVTWNVRNSTINRTFTINQKDVELVWGNTELTYNGSAQKPTATASGMVNDESLTVTVSGEQINANTDTETYTATASITDNNYKLPEVYTKEFTINPKEVTLEWGESTFTYNGEAQAPTATATGMVNDESLTVTVSGEQTNANTYTATASITDNNYKLPEVNTKEFTINPKAVTLEWGESTFTYNGEAQAPTATATGMVNDENLVVTVSGEQINANTDTETYTATASITDNNYKLPEVNTKEFTINPKAVTLEWGESTFTYNGTAQKPTATATGMVNDESLAVTVSGEQTNAGTYTATASITDNNYKLPEDATKEFTINPKEVTLEWSNTSFTYNGEAQAPTATATGLIEGDVCTVTVSGEQTNAGTAYTATVSALSNANYKLPEAVTTTFSIGKAMPTYTNPENLAINCKQTLADITLPTGFAFENENAALNIGGNTVTVSFTPENVDNYNVVSGIEVKVTKAHSAVTDAAAPATCTTDGHTEGSHCEICHAVLVAQEVIHAGHTAGAAVAENLKAATCTEAGSVDSVVYCTVCKEELSRKTVELTVIPHTPGEAVAENLKEATCTEAGSVDSVVYCTVCNAEVSRKTVEIHATGHSEVVDAAVAATCTESGLTEGSHCSVCNAIIKAQDVIPATGHKADSIAIENVVAATYTAAGSYDSVVYCSVCKVELSRTTIEVTQLVKPAEVEVVEVNVSQINYTVGDSLKLDGGKIVIATSDNTTAEVAITPEMVSGFNPDSVGVQTVTVEFTVNEVVYTTTFEVEVKAPEVIEVVAKSVALSAPAKVTYKKGEALDVTGGKLTVTYSDGTTQDVDLKADMVSGFDAEKIGAQQLTVTLKIDKVVLTATFDVTIEADDNTAISDDEAAAVNIYAYQNVIVVENATDDIYVYNAMGALIDHVAANADRTEIIVNGAEGVYIVKTGNTVKRVMVK